MLRLSKNITDIPIVSLRTSAVIATAEKPVINPNNLRVEGWYCLDVFSKQRLILLTKDVRDFVPQGIAINDIEDLCEPEELVRLQEILDYEYEVIGKPVVTNFKRKVGKVTDYALETKSMLIQKLYVARPMYRSITDGQLSIDRNQVTEVTDRKIIVKDVDEKVGSAVPSPLAVS